MASSGIIKLGQFLASKKFQPYEWAVNDCNTFIVDWIDHFYNTDWNGQLQFDYTDAVGAVRFHRALPFDAPEFMYMAGYDRCVGEPQSGDVILQNMRGYYASWLVLMDEAYTFQQDTGLYTQPVNTLEDYTLWRHP